MIALKAPGGRRCQHLVTCSPTTRWQSGDCVDAWVSERMRDAPREQWLLYNDETPARTFSAGGHCKGVLTWDASTVGWLVHSVPKWPATLPVAPLPLAECEYGQSFVWLTLPAARLPEVLGQLRLMQAHVYASSDDAEDARLFVAGGEDDDPTSWVRTVQLSPGVLHIAKHARWGRDLFEDAIAPEIGGVLATETWSRPGQPPTPHVWRVTGVRWPPQQALGDIAYSASCDHSKWGVSLSGARPWTWVGDVNAMASQFHRGGGGVLIRDSGAWLAMHSLVDSQQGPARLADTDGPH
jgi:hypothetical protein